MMATLRDVGYVGKYIGEGRGGIVENNNLIDADL